MSIEEEFYQHSIEYLETAQSVLSTCLRSITEDLEVLRSNGAEGYEWENAQVISVHSGLFKIHLQTTLEKVSQLGDDIVKGAKKK